MTDFIVTEAAMRPASTLRRCFYCIQDIWQAHLDTCVLITPEDTMTEYKELAARAEKMQAEMLAEGVNGWPNTVAMLIDGLAALEAEVANLAHDISVYIGANSELLANVDEARANRDSHQRVAIAAEARCKRLEEALANDNPLISYEGARFAGENDQPLIAADPDFVRCPRPCNHRPDTETVTSCNEAGLCGCVYHARIQENTNGG